MDEDDLRLRKQLNDGVRKAASNNDLTDPTESADHTPTGMGSEAAEGINDMGKHVQGERSGLDDRRPGHSFREGAERSGSEPLLGHTWLHESGYGGREGEARTSSDQREGSERRSSKREGAEQEGAEQEGVEQEGVEQGGVEQGGVEQGGVEQGGVEQGGVEQDDSEHDLPDQA